MDELAEPLIPNDFNPDKEVEEAARGKNYVPPEKTDLHFVRCIKPNDKKIKDTFVHAMTLQQINYMGVLESIKVKQDNFPYRKKYEDFYRVYELLSPAYSEGRYVMMSEDQKAAKKNEWKPLTEKIMERVFQNMEKEEYTKFYACGNSKILKMGEIKAVLDASKARAASVYDT